MSDYPYIDDIDFSIIINGWRSLSLLKNDLYLGMQGMNVGMTDPILTQWEYSLLNEYIEIEKTPSESAVQVSAFSQMWLLTTYEVMRIWRDRVYNYRKWYANGGLDQSIQNIVGDGTHNVARLIRKKLLEKYKDDKDFRERSDHEWELFQPVFRMVELLRMNLAKHAAPGKDSVIPRAPGYGRIDMLCGAMNYEVIDKENNYHYLNRRDVAEQLRKSFNSLKD